MACVGSGDTSWYLYNENWKLIKCVNNNLTTYSFTGITTPGTYYVTVVNDTYSGTTQIIITGNEEYCWDTYLYQDCDETCSNINNGLNVIKTGDNFELNYTPTGAVETFFKKINKALGFNSTKNISSRLPDISVLYSSKPNQGVGPYFETLMRSYECCVLNLTNETNIELTSSCINEPIYKVLKFCNTCASSRKILDYYFDEYCECTLEQRASPIFSACSIGTKCLENWDIKFLRYTGDCQNRELIEFDPINQSFSANCVTNINYGFNDCNCFYVAIGYRNNNILDNYARLNLVLEDCDPLLNGRTISYDLHGRSSIKYNNSGIVNSILNNTIPSLTNTPLCPIKPSCECLDINRVVDNNDGLPFSSGGTATYTYTETITITNNCYVPFNLEHILTFPSYPNLITLTSDFDCIISKNESAELQLVYVSTSQTPILGVIYYSATTTDDFMCDDDQYIDCSGFLPFSFVPENVPLTVSGGLHDFGLIGNGCCYTTNIDLTNTGDVNIIIYSASLTNPNFEITNSDELFGTPLEMGTYQTETLNVGFCSFSACTAGTISVSDIELVTNYGLLNGSQLTGGFGLSGTCINPTISASPSNFVYIKQIDEVLGETLYICNNSDYTQTVGMSDCLTITTGITSNNDPLGNGFQISYANEIISTINYPRSFIIESNECENFEIEYTTPIPDKTICTIYLTDNCGNEYNIPFTGYSLPHPIGITSLISENPTCFGSSTGSITIGFSGGSEIFQYTFSGESGVIQSGIASNPITFNNLSADLVGTTYMFSLSGDPCDGSQFVANLSPFIVPGDSETQYGPLYITLTEPELFSIIDTDYTGETCISSAFASVTVSGGVNNYIFEWSNGFIETGTTTPYTSIATGLTSGVYTIEISDNNGCQLISVIDIPPKLDIYTINDINNVSCYCNNDGLIFYQLYNAIDPVVYTWSGYTYDGFVVTPSHPNDSYTASTAINLTAGTYIVSYIDGNSCTGTSESLLVTQPNLLGFNVSATDLTCPYANNGYITFNPITGGTSPFTLFASATTEIFSATTGTIINGLSANTYVAYIIDNNNCLSDYKTITVNQPDPITLDIEYTATTCISSNDGQIIVNVTGGTAPYSFIWSPASSTNNIINNATSGLYNLTVYDSNDCFIITGFTLPYNTNHCGTTIITNNFDEELPIIGGSYLIDFPHTCINQQNEIILSFCQYSQCPVNILSITGITNTVDDFYLLNYNSLINSTIEASGCTTVTLVFNPTSATTYSSEFTLETTYCEYDFIVSGVGITQAISASTSFVDFGGVCFGTATTQNITILNLTPDDRDIVVQTTPTQFTPATQIISLSGYSSQEIPITFTPTYPFVYPPIRYLDFTGSTTISDCDDLNIPFSGYGYAGDVYVSNIDFGCINKNCSAIETATIYNHNCLPVTINSAELESYVSPYASILNFTGGTIPVGGTMSVDVSYTAITQLNTILSINVASNVFGIIYSGVSGCMVYPLEDVNLVYYITTIPGMPESVTIPITNNSNNILTINVSLTDLTGGTPTNLTVSPSPFLIIPAPVAPVTGVTSNLTLMFNDPNNFYGEFILTLTDNCGNIRQSNIYVNSFDVGLESYIQNNPTCYNFDNGSISVIGSGGTAPYTYIWDTGFTGNTISGLSADTYIVTISDFFGNSNNFNFTLTQPNELIVDAILSQTGSYNIGIYSANTGYIDVNVTGGTTPYTYFWDGVAFNDNLFTSTNQNISNLLAGIYNLTVTDANLCSINETYILDQPNPITITIDNCTPPVPPTPSCALTGGTAEMTVSGGECPYTVIVCPTTPQNPLFNSGGQYYGITNCVELQDCSVVPNGTPCTDISCYCCDDTIIPTTGCTESCPCTYCSIIIDNLPPGVYPPGSFGVIDVNSGSTTYDLPTFVPDPSTLGITVSTTPTTCEKVDDGTILLTVVPTYNQLGQIGMGTPPYIYYLDGIPFGPTTSTIHLYTGLTSNDYDVIVSDSDNNLISKTVRISENKVIVGFQIKAETENDQDGAITIAHITGGVGPYTGQITTSSSGITITAGYIFEDLVAGNYLLIVTDSIGCEFRTPVKIPRVLRKSGDKLSVRKKTVGREVKYEPRLGGTRII